MFQPVRGTHDLLPQDMAHHRAVVDQARRQAACYGFDEIQTPIFEFTGVFHRLGDASDIISKETYTFEDRGGESLTLRPEGTAAVMRAILSNGLTQNVPLKLFYHGPMFRYERPQKGRYRQHHQIGVELVGADSPAADAEVISLAQHIIDGLCFHDPVILQLNTLGDGESRAAYREALVAYFTKYRQDLSPDSQVRLSQNPLRILDSKSEKDRILVAEAPLYQDYLTPAAQAFFGEVQKNLDLLGIAYQLNPRLVRGLDYYCHTVFEFVTSALGAQGTVLAGGRYDGLLKGMGGPDLGGVGWASGVERLRALAQVSVTALPLFSLIPMGVAAEEIAFKMAKDLRHRGLCIDLAYGGAMTKRLKKANKQGAVAAVLLGEEELANDQGLVRHLGTGTQEAVALSHLGAYLEQTFLKAEAPSVEGTTGAGAPRTVSPSCPD